MGNETQGGFVVGKLDDGRFVAASTSNPYFCFRAPTEQDVVAKVRRAIVFWKARTKQGAQVSITQKASITPVRGGRTVSFDEVMEAA